MTERSAILRLIGEMSRHLDRGEGYRLGESTVVSRNVHLVTSGRPGEVDVVTDSDAGQVFYHRRNQGDILHLDIFHEIAEVDHRELARAVAAAATRYVREFKRLGGADIVTATTLGARRMADYIDIQTAAGGGRVTGGLGYGRGDALRKAHLTHVHLAVLASPRDAALIPYIVMAVENELGRAGREIRRIDKVNNVSGRKTGADIDLSDYASLSDSLLREPKRDWSAPRGAAGTTNPAYLRSVLDLADEFGGIDELREVLESLHGSPTWSQLHKKLRSRVPLNQVLSRLEGEGLLECGQGVYGLTHQGLDLRDFVARNHQDIELRFKRALRKLPFSGSPGRRAVVPSSATPPSGRGSLSYRRVAAVDAGAWVGQLAVPETLVSAVVRRAGSPKALRGEFLTREDLRVYRRRGLGPLDVCLLIDASASMAGPRMRAAKYLAQHLLLSTRDRVAVIVFQEREAGLYVPFTRNFQSVQKGLARVRPLGLTPLAEGLLEASAYVRRERTRDPLLLLITDGIPTVPRWSMNPVSDALGAAKQLAKDRVRFSCIGLEPNLDFLKDLAASAKGTLHVVEELDQALLSEIAHSERRRVRL
ncbi:MAG: VWA domain-containing protein [Bacillota bacterium]|nr:MAG: VWA domain-containing protein [Bacillota bacterium]